MIGSSSILMEREAAHVHHAANDCRFVATLCKPLGSRRANQFSRCYRVSIFDNPHTKSSHPITAIDRSQDTVDLTNPAPVRIEANVNLCGQSPASRDLETFDNSHPKTSHPITAIDRSQDTVHLTNPAPVRIEANVNLCGQSPASRDLETDRIARSREPGST